MIKKIALLLCLCCACPVSAGVRALGGMDDGTTTAPPVRVDVSNQFRSAEDTAFECTDEGFAVTECPEGYIPVHPCPLNRRYFKDCCPEAYRYTAEACFRQGMRASKETCLGLHACVK